MQGQAKITPLHHPHPKGLWELFCSLHVKACHSLPADEVELLSRSMRKFDLDGVIDPDAADLGETIIKAGLATFPNDPQLLILYANFMMEVRKDGPASRTQLVVSPISTHGWEIITLE